MTRFRRAQALSLAICLAACGGGTEVSTSDDTTTTAAPAAPASPTPVATPPATTPEPTDPEPTDAEPTDAASPAATSPAATSSPGTSAVGGMADYFQALDDQVAVDGLAVPGSPAAAYGTYLAHLNTATTDLGFPPRLGAVMQAVDGGFDLVDAASNRTIEFRDVQVDGDGLVVGFSRNGTPIADSVWTAPAGPDGDLGAGGAVGFANDQAFFVVMDVANATEVDLAIAGITFDVGGGPVRSDSAIDTYPSILAPGATRGMVFGTPGLAGVQDTPVTVVVEARPVDGNAVVSVEVTLQPVS